MTEHMLDLPVSEEQIKSVQALIGKEISAQMMTLLITRGYEVQVAFGPGFLRLTGASHPAGVEKK